MNFTLTKTEAEQLAKASLEKDGNPHQIIIIPEETKEYSFGYLIQCLPKKQVETGNWQKYGIPGLGPIIVDRADRSIHQLGSLPPVMAIEHYEKEWISKYR